MAEWRKSSFSADESCCAWVHIGPDLVQVQADDRRATLTFTHPEWAAFLAGVKAGEFDLGADHG